MNEDNLEEWDMEPRSFGSHLSMRCRLALFAGALPMFAALALYGARSDTSVLIPGAVPVFVGLLLLLVALVLALAAGSIQPALGAERGQRSLVHFLFLGLFFLGLSYTLASLWYGLLAPGSSPLLNLGLGAMGTSLLIFGARQFLSSNWRLMTRRIFVFILVLLWLGTILSVYDRIVSDYPSPFSSGSLHRAFTFLSPYWDLTMGSSSSIHLWLHLIPSITLASVVWLGLVLTPLFIWKSRSRRTVDVVDMLKSQPKLMGIAVAGFVSVLSLSLRGGFWSLILVLAFFVLLVTLLFAISRLGLFKFAYLRWLLLAILLVSAADLLLSLQHDLSSIRPVGFLQPAAHKLLRDSSLIMIICPLLLISLRKRMSFKAPIFRRVSILLSVVVLLVSFVPSVASYYRPVILNLGMEREDLEPGKPQGNIRLVVSFSINNRGTDVCSLRARVHLSGVIFRTKEIEVDAVKPGEIRDVNVSFAAIRLSRSQGALIYHATIELARDIVVGKGDSRGVFVDSDTIELPLYEYLLPIHEA